MSAVLIDGKLVSAKLRGEVTEKRIEFEKKYGRKPGLCVIRVGEDPASVVYVRNKLRACDINTLSPIEALNFIFELKKTLG